MSDYHARIMNISSHSFAGPQYKLGHRDARHAAAEIALEAEAEVERLRDKLRQRNMELSGDEEYVAEVERLTVRVTELEEAGYVRRSYVEALEAEVERLTADPRMALTWGDLNAALGNAQDRGLDHPQDAGTLAPMRERLRNARAALVAGEETK